MSINQEDLVQLDERYVKKDDCNDKMSKTDDRMDTVITDIAVMKSQMKTLIGILTTIAVPVLAIAVKYLFGGM